MMYILRNTHVEQLSDKINSVTCASSWNYILGYYYDARTHEYFEKCKIKIYVLHYVKKI
jgi:hypothetical protein